MRPSRFSTDQMVQAIEQVQGGTPAVQVCRRLGITQTTFYRWRARLCPVSVEDLREMRGLRVENQQLRQMVTDLLLQKQRRHVKGER
jgi:putative transposase